MHDVAHGPRGGCECDVRVIQRLVVGANRRFFGHMRSMLDSVSVRLASST